jgi:hypothetical protein
LRDGGRMRHLTIIGAGPSTWGPYADERAAINASADVIDRVKPDWNDAQKQVALAIGWAESRYGVTKDWLMPDGSPSWNWGATVAKGTAGTIPHADHTADNKPVTWNFAAFHTADEGFKFWADRFPKAALAAAADGNARGVSEGMYAACWFSGTCPPSCTDAARIDAYAKVILGAAKHVMPLVDTDGEGTGGGSILELGQTVGLPLGKCSWHDNYVPGGGGGGGGGGAKPPPSTTPATSGSDSGGGLWIAALALGVPLAGWVLLR